MADAKKAETESEAPPPKKRGKLIIFIVIGVLVKIDKTKYNVAFVSPQKNVYQRLEKLVKAGKWDKVYEDEISGIFVRK